MEYVHRDRREGESRIEHFSFRETFFVDNTVRHYIPYCTIILSSNANWPNKLFYTDGAT